jgi:hypothetical protein
MQAAQITQHIWGAGGETALMASPSYMADLARRGRLGALIHDFPRYHPYLLREQTQWHRLKRLVRVIIAPNGGVIRRVQDQGAPAGTGQRFQQLVAANRQELERQKSQGGFEQAQRRFNLRLSCVRSGTDTLEQLFELYGIETAGPFSYRSAIELGLRLPFRVLSRAAYDKQAHRDCATAALGHEPPWPRFKLTPTPIWHPDPRLLSDLGPISNWALVDAGILDPAEGARALKRAQCGDWIGSVWGGAAYFERYMRRFGY